MPLAQGGKRPNEEPPLYGGGGGGGGGGGNTAPQPSQGGNVKPRKDVAPEKVLVIKPPALNFGER
jgi:hypothetical protein